MKRFPITLAVLLTAGSLLTGRRDASAGGMRPPPLLNPQSYRSPSEEFVLEVDPGSRFGEGAGSYRLTRGKRELWKKRLPFTLAEAAVAEDGTAAGYAYTAGPHGYGELRIVILNPDGSLRLDERAKRESSRFLHVPPNPQVVGQFLDPENDRFVVRIADPDINRGQEEWRPFQLSSGKQLPAYRPATLMPDAELARWVLDARPVRGTPLSLVHWWRYQDGAIGARFTLIGLDGRPVWSLDLPQDYLYPADKQLEDRRQEWMRAHGAILTTEHRREFEVRFVRDGQRVRFSVQPAGEGWKVAEVERRVYQPPPPAPPQPKIPSRQLASLGAVTLRAPADTPQPIRDVSDLAFDGQGRIALLRPEADGSATFMRISQAGQVLGQVRLTALPRGESWRWTGFTWVGGDRFIVTRSNEKAEGGAAAWRVDFATSQARRLTQLAGLSVKRIAGFPDGRFVVLGTASHRYTVEEKVQAYDAAGHLRWSLSSNGADGSSPSRLFSPEDLAVTADGNVVVLDVIQHTLQYFDPSGRYQRTLALKKAWGREPSYPSSLAPDPRGGLVVEDFDGDPPVVRMDSRGKVRAQFQPRFRDGRTFTRYQLAVDPQGRLWTCDGYSALRLDATGRVDRILGSPPVAARLGAIRRVRLDGRGRIYAQAERTGAVHAFDPAGRHLYVCSPGAKQFDEFSGTDLLTVTRDGHVYLGDPSAGGVLHFGPNGRSLAPLSAKGAWKVPHWSVSTYQIRLDRPGRPALRIERRPDRNWLGMMLSHTASLDGRLIVMEGWLTGRVTVSLYSPEGKGLRTFQASSVYGPPDAAALGAGLLVLGAADGCVAYDLQGKPLWKFRPHRPLQGAAWQPFLRGNELLLFDGEQTLLRYRLPRAPKQHGHGVPVAGSAL
jgi:streptogramin lyase